MNEPGASFDSLPEAVQTIHKLQCGLNNQIKNFGDLLKKENDILKEVHSRIDKKFQELAATEKHIISTENQKNILSDGNEKLEKEIELLITEKVQLDHSATEMNMELESEKNALMKTREKMDSYRTSVRTLSNELDLSTQLVNTQQKVKELQQQKLELHAFCSEAKNNKKVTKEMIEELLKNKENIEQAAAQVKEEMMQVSEEQQKIEKETSVLIKRNRAQLLRLKKMVQESEMSQH